MKINKFNLRTDIHVLVDTNFVKYGKKLSVSMYLYSVADNSKKYKRFTNIRRTKLE